ncbi:MAG: hypothetical protein S0880_24865 [Actinomycetota bacterium]|nr:hypothetical protein [Actinomycetota bacterium]
MAPNANTDGPDPGPAPGGGAPDDPGAAGDPDAQLAAYSARLADAVEAALATWVVREVGRIMVAWSSSYPDDVRRRAEEAGERARAETMPRLRRLLEADVDEQRTGPLAVIRAAVAHPTAVLADAGVPPVARDEFAERQFPDDVYDLSPAAFADLDPSVHEPGLEWGAAKAHVVLTRRRAEGKR